MAGVVKGRVRPFSDLFPASTVRWSRPEIERNNSNDYEKDGEDSLIESSGYIEDDS